MQVQPENLETNTYSVESTASEINSPRNNNNEERRKENNNNPQQIFNEINTENKEIKLLLIQAPLGSNITIKCTGKSFSVKVTKD